ncbi:DUF3789 domain-containing protein [Enterococcus casseliflavus]
MRIMKDILLVIDGSIIGATIMCLGNAGSVTDRVIGKKGR